MRTQTGYPVAPAASLRDPSGVSPIPVCDVGSRNTRASTIFGVKKHAHAGAPGHRRRCGRLLVSIDAGPSIPAFNSEEVLVVAVMAGASGPISGSTHHCRHPAAGSNSFIASGTFLAALMAFVSLLILIFAETPRH